MECGHYPLSELGELLKSLQKPVVTVFQTDRRSGRNIQNTATTGFSSIAVCCQSKAKHLYVEKPVTTVFLQPE